MKDREIDVQDARAQERRRIVGRMLAEVGRLRLTGQTDMADALDALALQIEHPELDRPTA
jgi:hypothetical protein